MLIEASIFILGIYLCNKIIDSCIIIRLDDVDVVAPITTTKKNHECSICLESLKGKNVRLTTCGHMFCPSCIENWLKIKMRCPNCNFEFTSENLSSCESFL